MKYDGELVFKRFLEDYKKPIFDGFLPLAEEMILVQIEEILDDLLWKPATTDNIMTSQLKLCKGLFKNGYLQKQLKISPLLKDVNEETRVVIENEINEKAEMFNEMDFEIWAEFLGKGILSDEGLFFRLGVYNDNIELIKKGEMTIYDLLVSQPLIFLDTKL